MNRLETQVGAKLKTVGARLEVQVGAAFSRDANTVVASTAQSYKGYESEVVVVAGADKFVARDRGILANNLYVAMTRARSLLAVYGVKGKTVDGGQIMTALCECLSLLTEVPAIHADASPMDVETELLHRIGMKHRVWLKAVMKQYSVEQDPICAADREIIAEPLFWFGGRDAKYACFAEEPMMAVRHRLEDAGFKILLPGADVG